MSEKKLAQMAPEPVDALTEVPLHESDEGGAKEPADREEEDAKEPAHTEEGASGKEEPDAEQQEEAVATDTDEKPQLPPRHRSPPPMPSRPSPHVAPSHVEQTVAQLVDVFPGLDLKYIKMALIASEGRLEPASNALLFLSDPDSGIEIPNPEHAGASSHSMNSRRNNNDAQLKTDEELARSLARSYESRPRPQGKLYKTPSMSKHEKYNEYIDYNNDSDEDLYEAFTKNVNDAKQMVGSWFGNVAKKFQVPVDQETEREQNYRSQKTDRRNLYQRQSRVYDDADKELPKLPPRKQGKEHLYSAVNPSDGSVTENPTPHAIELTDETADASVVQDDDKLYTADSAQLSIHKKATETGHEVTPTNASDLKSNAGKKWSSLKSSDPEPSSDAFLVEDSEDDEEK